jgi:hypothetical protein
MRKLITFLADSACVSTICNANLAAFDPASSASTKFDVGY